MGTTTSLATETAVCEGSSSVTTAPEGVSSAIPVMMNAAAGLCPGSVTLTASTRRARRLRQVGYRKLGQLRDALLFAEPHGIFCLMDLLSAIRSDRDYLSAYLVNAETFVGKA